MSELIIAPDAPSAAGPYSAGLVVGDWIFLSGQGGFDPDTGELVWAFQVTPHDMWDYDAVNENILVDLPIGGVTRNVLVHFDRNGFAYTIDRATGQVLLAKPYVPMNWSSGVDLATGRPTVIREKTTNSAPKISNICPSLEGGKNQQPAAF